MAKATSKSLMQNIPAETVHKILADIGSESVLSKVGPTDVVAAMGVLPDMPAPNNTKTSGAFVIRALKGGFKANDLQRLPTALKMAQHHSELPAASVLEGVASQMKHGVPARQIIQNLFNGKVGGGPPGNKPNGLGNGSNHGHSNGN